MSAIASPRLARMFFWVSALVFVTGAVAFSVVYLGDDGTESAPPANAPAAVELPPDTAKKAPVPRQAREVAGRFLLTAVTRDDLAKGWKLLHPDLKRECACSYKEWLKGDIPVQFYPGDAIDGATFAVSESTKNHVVLDVVVFAKRGADVKDQAFTIGLKPVGKAKQRRWLVYYFAPRSVIPVPSEVN